jgi:CheY-like chemotaxis protein
MMSGPNPTPLPWRVLIVDDEEGIHGITRMIFRGYVFEGRPVELISALSGRQAREQLARHGDIALVLLDVVMEADDEGLRLVNFIREELGNAQMRIILRTGHPGFAPETDIIVRYDINDYLSKAELSASRLLTSVVVALRAYRDIGNAGQQAWVTLTDQPASGGHTLLGQMLQPLLNEAASLNRRLQQFDLNPMAQDLLLELNAQQARLACLCRQLDERPPTGAPVEVEPRALLNQLMRTLLPLARTQRRLLDYRLQENLPLRLQLHADATAQLWLALLEHVMNTAPQTDLLLTLRYHRQAATLELLIQGGASPADTDPLRESYWRDFGRAYCERLARMLGGELDLLSLDPASVWVSCSIGATRTG